MIPHQIHHRTMELYCDVTMNPIITSEVIMTSHRHNYSFAMRTHVLQLDVFIHCNFKINTVINTYLFYIYVSLK